MQIPDEKLWGNWKEDLDKANAYRTLHGKSIKEVAGLFAENPIEIAETLRFAPCRVAIVYLRGCIDYLKSDASEQNADAASSLLRLILEMVRTCPSEVFSPIGPFLDSVRMLSERQSVYGADPDIYGSFLQTLSDIKILLTSKK